MDATTEPRRSSSWSRRSGASGAGGAGGASSPSATESAEPAASAPSVLRFRNYTPTSAALRKLAGASESAARARAAVEDAERALADAGALRPREGARGGVVAPKRANEDLKRELEAKTRKLARMTRAAIETLASGLREQQQQQQQRQQQP